MKQLFGRCLAATGLSAALLLMVATPATAQSTININPGNVPTTAAAFTQVCDPNLGGGPFPDQDVWVFNLPGNPQTSGVFLSVTATFNTPNGVVTRTITTDGGAIVNDMGTSKAWIRLPAGWTLTGATAVISGVADFFVLTHTCAASGTPTPTVTPTPIVTVTPTVAPTRTATVTSTVAPTRTATVKPTLPVTGTGSGPGGPASLLVAGVVAVAAGTGVLMYLRRRRDTQA